MWTSCVLPAGATASFTPSSISGSDSSVLTVSTAASTPRGTYTLSVTGTTGSLVRTTTVSLMVGTDFSLQVLPANQAISSGTTGSYTVSITPVAGFADTVNLAVSGLPAGATATFTPA